MTQTMALKDRDLFWPTADELTEATEPAVMARAFAMAAEAGRAAYLAGPMDERDSAQASTPVVGMPFWHQDQG